MQKTLMILGAGEMQIPVIRKAKDLGLNIVTIDGDIKAPGNQYADLALEIDTNDKIGILETAQKYRIDGILTTSDYPVRVVAYVCDKLGLKGLNRESAEISTNKYLLRECLFNNATLTPKYQKISCIEDLKKLDSKIHFPLIIKPVDSSASRGIKKVEKFSELSAAYNEAIKHSRTHDVLIEEFLIGPEYSVEALSQNGKISIVAITEKKTTGYEDKYFVEDRHVIPADLSKSQQRNIYSTVFKAIKAIGLDNSASHTEIKLTQKGPVIIEIGARLGGDFITSDLVPLATGIDMLEGIINISIGNKINTKRIKNVFAGIQFINSDNYHFAKKHIKNIKTKTGLIKTDLKEYKQFNLKSSLDRLGYIICISNTRSRLDKLLNFK